MKKLICLSLNSLNAAAAAAVAFWQLRTPAAGK